MAEGGALMMIYTLWRPTTLGGRAFSQPEGLFELDIINVYNGTKNASATFISREEG